MCRIVLIVLTLAYVAALALLAVGTFGAFGQERDPLAAVFLLPLGLPWMLLGNLSPDPAPVWAILAPALNIALVALLCRWRQRRGRG